VSATPFLKPLITSLSFTNAADVVPAGSTTPIFTFPVIRFATTIVVLPVVPPVVTPVVLPVPPVVPPVVPELVNQPFGH